MCEENNKLKDLLKRLYEATDKLNGHYCTILNRENFNEAMTGEEYDKIADVFVEVEEFLEKD